MRVEKSPEEDDHTGRWCGEIVCVEAGVWCLCLQTEVELLCGPVPGHGREDALKAETPDLPGERSQQASNKAGAGLAGLTEDQLGLSPLSVYEVAHTVDEGSF